MKKFNPKIEDNEDCYCQDAERLDGTTQLRLAIVQQALKSVGETGFDASSYVVICESEYDPMPEIQKILSTRNINPKNQILETLKELDNQKIPYSVINIKDEIVEMNGKNKGNHIPNRNIAINNVKRSEDNNKIYDFYQ
jgi:hypothetical protein